MAVCPVTWEISTVHQNIFFKDRKRKSNKSHPYRHPCGQLTVTFLRAAVLALRSSLSSFPAAPQTTSPDHSQTHSSPAAHPAQAFLCQGDRSSPCVHRSQRSLPWAVSRLRPALFTDCIGNKPSWLCSPLARHRREPGPGHLRAS